LGKSSKVTKENYDLIEKGMTKREVTAMLGKPNTAAFKWIPEGKVVWDTPDENGPMIMVEFDPEDRVMNKTWFYPTNRLQPSLLDRVIDWFR
jgi:hypothetical protein